MLAGQGRSNEETVISSQAASAEILVIVPTLGDRVDFLRQTLESVSAQRKDVRLNLVVVSPASAAEARRAALDHDAYLVDDPREGISAAMNCALRSRTTERYVTWLGDDDLLREGGLSRLSRELKQDPEAVVAYGACDYIDPTGRTLWVSAAGRAAKILMPWGPNLIPNPASMMRADAVEAIGGFDESLKYAMDLDAFLSLRKYGHFRATRQVVAAFRWHPESLTVSNRSASAREAEAVKRRHLPAYVRPFAPVWVLPVRWASSFAASRVSARARGRW